MAKLTTDLDGSATVKLSDGLRVHIPAFVGAPQVETQDLRNLISALCELVNNLDNRLAALEQRQAVDQIRRCQVGPAF